MAEETRRYTAIGAEGSCSHLPRKQKGVVYCCGRNERLERYLSGGGVAVPTGLREGRTSAPIVTNRLVSVVVDHHPKNISMNRGIDESRHGQG